MSETDPEFIVRLINLLAKHKAYDLTHWYPEAKEHPIRCFVNCNDFFYWGTADGEEVTPENIDVLEEAFREVVETPEVDIYYESYWGAMVFCCKMRGMRPQGACYPSKKYLWPLFDVCGPEREINLVNPKKPGG